MIERNNEVKYNFQKNNGDMKQIRRMLKKARKTVRQVWSIGKKKIKTYF